jgi:hypothetical protein
MGPVQRWPGCTQQRKAKLIQPYFQLRHILYAFLCSESQGIEKKAARVIESSHMYKRTCIVIKVNFTLEQATKAKRGSRGIALLFL